MLWKSATPDFPLNRCFSEDRQFDSVVGMAKRIIEQYVSDLSGVELPEGTSSLRFSFDGRSYEIDLTPDERARFESAIAMYVAAARPAAATRAGRAGRSSNGPDPKVVRAWAKSAGLQVPERGRIPATLVEAYNAAH